MLTLPLLVNKAKKVQMTLQQGICCCCDATDTVLEYARKGMLEKWLLVIEPLHNLKSIYLIDNYVVGNVSL